MATFLKNTLKKGAKDYKHLIDSQCEAGRYSYVEGVHKKNAT